MESSMDTLYSIKAHIKWKNWCWESNFLSRNIKPQCVGNLRQCTLAIAISFFYWQNLGQYSRIQHVTENGWRCESYNKVLPRAIKEMSDSSGIRTTQGHLVNPGNLISAGHNYIKCKKLEEHVSSTFTYSRQNRFVLIPTLPSINLALTFTPLSFCTALDAKEIPGTWRSMWIAPCDSARPIKVVTQS